MKVRFLELGKSLLHSQFHFLDLKRKDVIWRDKSQYVKVTLSGFHCIGY